MQTMDEIYHIYHRSVVSYSMIIFQQIDFDPPSSSNAHIMARWNPSISVLNWLNKVTPRYLLDDHGFPMSFLAGTVLKTVFCWW